MHFASVSTVCAARKLTTKIAILLCYVYSKGMKSNFLTFFYSFLGMGVGYLVANHSSTLLYSKAWAGGKEPANALSAKEFNLVDSSGKRRIQMGTTEQGVPGIWFYGKNGKVKLTFGLYEDDNAYIVLNDENQQAVQIFRTMGAENSPFLVMKAKGQDRMVLGLSGEKQDPFFVYYDDKGAKHTLFGNW